MALKISLYRLIGLSARAERHLDVFLSRRAYRKAFGNDPNLEHPALFSEKVIARKLFDRRPVFSRIADKLLVREFVAERIGRQFLPEVYLVCNRFEQIDFDRLPDKFVIKTNHGSGWTLIVDNRETFDRAAAQKMFHRWMRANYYFHSREFFYKSINRKIMIEEFLQEASGAPAIDYRFYVYDGAPKFVQIRTGAMNNFYDRDCQKLPVKYRASSKEPTPTEAFRKNYHKRNPTAEFTFPPNMDRLFDIAGNLGRGFDFIRVDLYNPSGKILTGELTSLPAGGVRPFDPPIYDRIFGETWNMTLCDSQSSYCPLPERQPI